LGAIPLTLGAYDCSPFSSHKLSRGALKLSRRSAEVLLYQFLDLLDQRDLARARAITPSAGTLGFMASLMIAFGSSSPKPLD